MVLDLKFPRQGLNSAVRKMCALITHQDYWTSKSTYDVFKNELCSCSSITIPYCFGLYPPGEVFCSCDDVSRASSFPWWVDRTHKIYSPLVKFSQRNLWSQHISSLRKGFPTLWQISQHLQNSLMSLCKVGDHNLAARIF